MCLSHIGTVFIFVVQKGETYTLSTPFIQHSNCLLGLISL